MVVTERGDTEEMGTSGPAQGDPFAAHISADEGPAAPEVLDPAGSTPGETAAGRVAHDVDDIEIVLESDASGLRTTATSETSRLQGAGAARFVVPSDGIAADQAPEEVAGSRPEAEIAATMDLVREDVQPASPSDADDGVDDDDDDNRPANAVQPTGPTDFARQAGAEGAAGEGEDHKSAAAEDAGRAHLPLPDTTIVAEVVAATGIMASDQLAEAVALAAGGSLAEAITKTVGGPEEVAKARARHYGVPFVDLGDTRVHPDALAAIPFDVLERVIAVPYALTEGKVLVAVADPGDVQALDELRLASKFTVRLAVAVREEIEVELRKISRQTEATERSSLMDVEFRAEDDELDAEEDLSAEDQAPIARLFASILQQAANDGASDVHLDPTDEGLLVRFRVDGVLQEVQLVPKRLASSLTTLIKVMGKLDIAERRKPQDGRITMTAKSVGRELDVRLALLPTVRGECCVMRLLDTSSEPPTLEMLGFAEDVQNNFEEIVARPTGALLVTGPTGSGKSTTLYATLAEIHRPEINVITVEDPVEYRLSGLQQVQINKKAGLTFATALRSILRADPDVIMVGEIRDVETAQISIESALTGHLVLSTLHTNDAPSAITRLTEMGVEPFLVGAAVSGVIAQRLARLLCTCKVPYEPTPEELQAARVPEDWRARFGTIYKPGECARCGKTGYKGRVGVYQLMVMSDDMVRLASSGGTRDALEELARKEGMKTLWEAGLEAVLEGKTCFVELRRVLVS